jgi:hypothetical protein
MIAAAGQTRLILATIESGRTTVKMARDCDSGLQNVQENLGFVNPKMPSAGVTAMRPFI